MTSLTIAAGNSGTINTSGTYELTLGLLSTLSVTENPGLPGIPVNAVIDTLSVTAGDVFTVSKAHLTFATGLSVSVADTFNIGTAGTLELGSGVGISALSLIDFTGTAGTLVLDQTGGTISLLSPLGHFGNNGTNAATLDLRGQVATGENITGNAITGFTLHVTNAGGTIANLSLAATSSHDVSKFHLVSDGNGGTNVVACFLEGTLITTPDGDVPIEALCIGDLVTTGSGIAQPVRWIGRRSYAARFAAGNPAVLPIRIAAGALADRVPRRDLLVSPKHAMLLEGMLIPAEALVNGRSIRYCTELRDINYVHVELQAHDILLAEGAASESYCDCDNRGMFQNGDEADALYPGDDRLPWTFCAPRLEDGLMVAAVRSSLAGRAGTPARPGLLMGHVERQEAGFIEGWAADSDDMLTPVELEVLLNEIVVDRVLANQYRADLDRVGMAGGRCGLRVAMPAGAGEVMLRRSSDGVELPTAPYQRAIRA